MPVIARVRRWMHEKKPPHGAPCTNCGVCCAVSVCPLGQHFFGIPERPGPCPALLIDEKAQVSACALVMAGSDEEYREAAKTIIDAGGGCDCRLHQEPRNPAFDRRCAERDIERADEIAAAKRLWGMD